MRFPGLTSIIHASDAPRCELRGTKQNSAAVASPPFIRVPSYRAFWRRRMTDVKDDHLEHLMAAHPKTGEHGDSDWSRITANRRTFRGCVRMPVAIILRV
jgi:hypothetical protein